MTGILDRYLEQQAGQKLQSVHAVFGLALADVLGDRACADIYQRIAADYPHAVLAHAAKRLPSIAPKVGKQMFAEFYRVLTHVSHADVLPTPAIVALKIERKATAVAVFLGTRLVRAEMRNLAYANDLAARAIAGLIRRLSEDHPEASFAIDMTADVDTRRGLMVRTALDAMREHGLPLWRLSAADLLSAYGNPACKTREEMRSVVRDLFSYEPELVREAIQVDALAVGLLAYCRTLLNAAREKGLT